jgi:N-acyl homoserine lactone hydrolase
MAEGIKVYPLYLGDMFNESTYTILGDTQATPGDPHAEHRLKKNPSTAYLIKHPDVGYIMYDTGMPDDPKNYWPDFINAGTGSEKPAGTTMREQLALVGVKPEDINYVVSSHMHVDHIGCDKLFAKTADFIVSRAEAHRAYCDVMHSSDPKTHGFYLRDEVLMQRKSITYLDEDTPDLFPGIDAYIFPGHTPGVICLYVHLKGQDLFLLEDACACQKNYDGIPSGGCYDSLGDARSIQRIRRITEKGGALPLFGHDEIQFESMKFAPDFYE